MDSLFKLFIYSIILLTFSLLFVVYVVAENIKKRSEISQQETIRLEQMCKLAGGTVYIKFDGTLYCVGDKLIPLK